MKLTKKAVMVLSLLGGLAFNFANAATIDNDFGDTTTDYDGSNTGTGKIAVDTVTGVAINGATVKALENGKVHIVDTGVESGDTSQLSHGNVAVNKSGKTTFSGNAVNLTPPATYDVVSDSEVPVEIAASGGVIFEFDQADSYLNGLSFNYQKVSSGYYRVAVYYSTDNSANWTLLAGPIVKNIGNTNNSQPQTYTYSGSAIEGVDAIRIAMWANSDNTAYGWIIDNLSMNLASHATNNDSFITQTATEVSGNVKTNDLNASAIDAVLQSGPSNHDGAFTLNTDGSFTYTPVAGFAGTDSFTYALDGLEATAYITVEGQVLNYEMNDTAGSTTLADSSGNSRTSGTISNAEISLTGSALSFSDVDMGSTVMTGDLGITYPTNTVTFCAWIKPSLTSANSTHAGILTTTDNGICFRYSDKDATKGVISYIWQGYGESSVEVTRGQWNFVAMTVTASAHNFYSGVSVSGDVAALNSQSMNKGTVTAKTISTMRIGRERYDYRTFHGGIKKLRVWNYTLSAAELQNLYATENPLVYTPVTGIEVVQTGTELQWTVESEAGVKEYQIVDSTTGEIVDVVIADGSGSYSTTLPEGASAKVVVVDQTGYTQAFYPESNGEVTVEYDLQQGWNLISLPTANADLTELFSVASGGFWTWDGSSYQSTSTLSAGQGFWIFAESTENVTVTGEKTANDISLQSGWNLIGPSENIEAPTDYLIYGWDKAYIETNTMTAGNGYWIYSEKADMVQLP